MLVDDNWFRKMLPAGGRTFPRTPFLFFSACSGRRPVFAAAFREPSYRKNHAWLQWPWLVQSKTDDERNELGLSNNSFHFNTVKPVGYLNRLRSYSSLEAFMMVEVEGAQPERSRMLQKVEWASEAHQALAGTPLTIVRGFWCPRQNS